MDSIANFLTIIRNGYMARLKKVSSPYSKIKENLSLILKDQGYIESVAVRTEDKKKFIDIDLKYDKGEAVVSHIKRVSKPGLRVYKKAQSLNTPLGGLGVLIVSTPRGLMTEREARKKRLGGEVLCEVW